MAIDSDFKTLGDMLLKKYVGDMVSQMQKPWFDPVPNELKCGACQQTTPIKSKLRSCPRCLGTERDPCPFEEVWGI